MGLTRSVLRIIWYVFLYALVIWYTLTFSTTVAWFLFYSFTLLLLIAYLSSRHTPVISSIDWDKINNNEIVVSLTVQSKRGFPLLLSSIDLTLFKDNQQHRLHRSSFLARKVKATFEPIELSRGYHDHLTLTLDSSGLFGIFPRRLNYNIPIAVSIYPAVIQKSKRSELMRKLTQTLTPVLYSPLHEFYVKEIRSYQDRDAISSIDWKSSLRRGQWLVKDYDTLEESPFDLFFYGAVPTEFEFLLSVTYTLYKELTQSFKVNLHLVGDFDHNADIKYTQKHFLTIQPASNKEEASHILRRSLTVGRNHLIIMASDATTPSNLTEDPSVTVLDEHALHFLKGG
ncbi:MAG: DUF58 domain-containing protein [Alkalibacterium sp.]|nr:DUF58 domain-containing protein [Alkalibacterium sp.]